MLTDAAKKTLPTVGGKGKKRRWFRDAVLKSACTQSKEARRYGRMQAAQVRVSFLIAGWSQGELCEGGSGNVPQGRRGGGYRSWGIGWGSANTATHIVAPIC